MFDKITVFVSTLLSNLIIDIMFSTHSNKSVIL